MAQVTSSSYFFIEASTIAIATLFHSPADRRYDYTMHMDWNVLVLVKKRALVAATVHVCGKTGGTTPPNSPAAVITERDYAEPSQWTMDTMPWYMYMYYTPCFVISAVTLFTNTPFGGVGP